MDADETPLLSVSYVGLPGNIVVENEVLLEKSI